MSPAVAVVAILIVVFLVVVFSTRPSRSRADDRQICMSYLAALREAAELYVAEHREEISGPVRLDPEKIMTQGAFKIDLRCPAGGTYVVELESNGKVLVRCERHGWPVSEKLGSIESVPSVSSQEDRVDEPEEKKEPVKQIPKFARRDAPAPGLSGAKTGQEKKSHFPVMKQVRPEGEKKKVLPARFLALLCILIYMFFEWRNQPPLNDPAAMARLQECRKNMKKLRVAALRFMKDKSAPDDAFPSLEQLVESGYLERIPVCPSGGYYITQITGDGSGTVSFACDRHGPLSPALLRELEGQ